MKFNAETQRRELFLIAATRDLDENIVYAKERKLVEDVKFSLDRGRRVQTYAVYTQKRDVTRRLERILGKEGIRVAVLTREVAPELREAWYERQLRSGVHVVIVHPRLVQTGLDLWSSPDIFLYETGYSIYTLRQASRRSWRIRQRSNVNVKFFYYAGTMQEARLRLMGKKLLGPGRWKGNSPATAFRRSTKATTSWWPWRGSWSPRRGSGKMPLRSGDNSSRSKRRYSEHGRPLHLSSATNLARVSRRRL